MFHPYKANIVASNVRISPIFSVFYWLMQGWSAQRPIELFDSDEVDCDAEKAAFTKTARKLLSASTDRGRFAAARSDQFAGAYANRPGGLIQAIRAFSKSAKHCVELA